MSKLAVGVVGLGRMGMCHAENLRWRIPEAKLVAIAAPHLENARRRAAELEIEDAYPSLEALLERKELDAVVIASPTRFHAVGVHAAAAAGKHVFCEKPPALTLADADAAIAVARRKGVAFQVALNRRFDPAFVAAYERVTAGAIGKPILFRSLSRDRESPPLNFYKGGAGPIFVDMGMHDFDAARWLMSDEVSEVHAYGAALVSRDAAQFGDFDTAVANLRFAGGALGQVEALRQSVYGYDIRAEVVGTEGTVQIGDLRQTGITVLKRDGIRHDAVPGFIERYQDAYLNELRSFVQCVQAGLPVRVTGEDARSALAIALAADRSQREGRPVRLAEVETAATGSAATQT